MSAANRVLSRTSLRTALLALVTLAGVAPAMAAGDGPGGRGNGGGNRGGGGGGNNYRGGGGNSHGGGGNNYHGNNHNHGGTSWGISTFSSGYYGSGAAFGFSTSNGHHSGTSFALGLNFPVYTRPYCPPPVYCAPTYYAPVRRVYVESAPVIYTQPQVIYTQPQVIYSTPAPVVVQQPQQVVVQQPAQVTQQVIQAPAPAPAPQITNVIMASATPGQVAAARAYRDVTPNDLNISALRTGDTVVVMVNGSNTMEGYSTSLSINDASADATLVLHNEPPLVTQALRNTNFAVNASVRLSGNPTTIGVKVAGQAYQVPIVDVPSVTDSNAAR